MINTITREHPETAETSITATFDRRTAMMFGSRLEGAVGVVLSERLVEQLYPQVLASIDFRAVARRVEDELVRVAVQQALKR